MLLYDLQIIEEMLETNVVFRFHLLCIIICIDVKLIYTGQSHWLQCSAISLG